MDATIGPAKLDIHIEVFPGNAKAMFEALRKCPGVKAQLCCPPSRHG